MKLLLIPFIVLVGGLVVTAVIAGLMAVHPILGIAALGVVFWRLVTIGPIRWR